MAKGLHILGELYECENAMYLENAELLYNYLINAVNQSKLTIVGGQFHQFHPTGSTCFILLEESHVSIHTWPELGIVNFDVFVCNFACNNTEKADIIRQFIIDIFKPKYTHIQSIFRGEAYDII